MHFVPVCLIHLFVNFFAQIMFLDETNLTINILGIAINKPNYVNRKVNHSWKSKLMQMTKVICCFVFQIFSNLLWSTFINKRVFMDLCERAKSSEHYPFIFFRN